MRIIEDESIWMTLKESAKYVGVSINTFKNIMAVKKDFPVVRFNKRLMRVNRAELDAWLILYGRGQILEDPVEKKIEKEMKETVEEEGPEHYE